jgi:hypothetical protein
MTDELNKIINDTRNRAQYFQTVHAWPLNDKLDYEGWLSNFSDESELKIACSIIDFFLYYPSNMVDEMLRTSIGYAGLHLSKMISDWKHFDFLNRCYYSFIPGENPNPTDSGHIFTRKLRDVLEIPENRIINYSDIASTLSHAKKTTPVILVDDFVGSGSQCITAWNYNKFPYNKKTFKEISESDGHIFIYAPLIVNQIGFQRIRDYCPNLILTPTHVIGSEYNLFSKDCICWKNNDDLFKTGTELILKKSKELGIPFTNGRHPQDVRGFGEQGLALAFEHGAPDAIPSFFYWCAENWTPLIKKTYTR